MEKATAILLRYWGYLLALNAFILLVTVISAATAPKTWTATAKLILPNTNAGLEASLGTLGSFKNTDPSFSTQVNPLNVQVSILTSDALMQRMLDQDPEKRNFVSTAQYSKLFSVKPQEQSTIILLTVSGSSQNLTLRRAIAMTKAYQERLNELRTTDRATRAQFSEQELKLAKRRLEKAQTALEESKESSGIVSINDQTQGLVSMLTSLTTTQAQAQAQAESSKTRVDTLAQRLGMTPDQAIRSLSLSENKDYQAIRGKLAVLVTSVVEARSLYSDDHPKVQVLLTQREELQRQLQQLVAQAAVGRPSEAMVAGGEGRAALLPQLITAESDASAQRQQADQLRRQVENLYGSLKALPAKQGQLLELQRQYDVAEGIYKGFVAQAQQINIDPFNSYPNVQVLDPPSVVTKPTSKKMLIIINGLLAAIVGSIALILFLERRDPHLVPKDLQQMQLPVLSCIPHSKRLRNELELDADVEVVFQQFASLISLKPLQGQRLLVTSASLSEGKTTVVIGLALALVDLGFRVLVVDGDFRHAGLSARFGCTLNWLAEDAPVPLKPGLDLAPMLPQPGNIIELLARGRFAKSLSIVQATHAYDYVLVDSAPISLTSETMLMVADIANILFVVHPGISRRHVVQESFHQLSSYRANILGLVVNGVAAGAKPILQQLKTASENS